MLSGTTPTSIGFTGEWTDPNVDLVFLHAQWYNPSSGTFLSRDPFAGYPTQPYSLHPYQYAYSSPLVNTDHSGRCSYDTQSLDDGVSIMCNGGSGGGSGDDIGPINGGRQDIPAVQPPPSHPLQNPKNWQIPQTPYVPEGSAGPLNPPAPSAPRPAPQPYTPGGFPLPSIPTRYLPGMMQCASDLDPYEHTQPQPQPYPQQARPDTDDERRESKQLFFRTIDAAPGNPKNYKLRQQDHGMSTFTDIDAQYVLVKTKKDRLIVIPSDAKTVSMFALAWHKTKGTTGDILLDDNHWELYSPIYIPNYQDWWNTTVSPALANEAIISNWTQIKRLR